MGTRIHRRFPTEFVLPERLDFVGLYYDRKGYRILVAEFSQEDAQKIEINFEGTPLAQRSMDEGSYLCTTWTADEVDGPVGPVVLVENSEFLDWFNGQSCGIYPRDQIKHVAILTQNEWVEVLCLKLPSIFRIVSI
ncbi:MULTISPECIES: hypothetical protein [Pseudomonas]|uniref:hypothetical protein n=1 Tax=Pseudomonas TaxID=286 RepID=UPI0011AB6875|nr:MULTISPECIES: hypothetical protein [Pseudomonas]NTX93375.1 hypothetical protein [Pseudomonas sp. UMA643]NTY34812.1 hypothetical protein [Pseudomonas sp. UMC3129]NTY57919.1 hypothetical protein [Pseudomonas sp. UMC631]NTY69875.1 hypothetical protein [Pseudomonas sp. UMC3106]NUA38244.1 hypothetical protein [Pseudomonas sp. UMA601]